MNAAQLYDPLEAPTHTLQTIRASELEARDTVVASGCVPLLVTGVDDAVYSFVTARYSCLSGSGHRVYASEHLLEVLRPVPEAAL